MDTIAMLLPDGVGPAAGTLLVIASFFTSALTAAFGIGGGVAMLALLGLFVPVAALIPVHGAIQLGSNTGRVWHQRANVRMDIAGPFIAGSVVGAVLGVFVVVQLPDAAMKILLGAFLLFVIWVRIPGIQHLNRAGLAAASVPVSALNMLVGVTGPMVSVLFAQFLHGDRRALVATNAAALTAQHALKIVFFGLAGFAFRAWLPLIAVMIVSGFAGTICGTRVLEGMPEATFRFWFRIAVSILALDMLRRGLLAL